MAVGGSHQNEYEEHISQENLQEQNDELLALQSIFEGPGVKRVQVLNTPGENGAVYVLLLTVPVELDGHEVTVTTERSEDDLKDDMKEGLPPEKIGTPEQTGIAEESVFTVKYLPPLVLEVVLPRTYPSQHAPEVTLSCEWLTTNQLLALCRQIDRLWEESQNSPIIFTWVDWLENNVISFLEIGTAVTVCVDESPDADPRTVGPTDIRHAVETIYQYNKEQESAEFYRSDHECPVCCDDVPGGQLYRLDSCGHYFCQDCMAAFCKHHVSLGTVEHLKCPDTGCDSIIPPNILQSVLPSDDFDRWERLLLQKTLESMTDMDWCPRCNCPVIREAEEDLNLGHCTTCFFAFCTTCRDPWHQGEPCVTVEEKLAELEDSNMVSSASAAAVAAETTRFEERRRKLEEEVRTRLSLQKKTRLCPKCGVKIEKTGGCNMMTCRCGSRFCWMCGQVTKHYSHFRLNGSRCSMMDMTEISSHIGAITPQNVDYVQGMVYGHDYDLGVDHVPRPRPRLVVETVNCPTCRYRNVKAGRNNHIKCGCCSTNYCFVCKGKIVGVVTSHFTSGTCPQHS